MKKVSILAACISALTLFSCEGQKGKSTVALHNTADSVAYGIGVSIGTNMKHDGLDSLNLDILKNAIAAVFRNDSLQINSTQAQGVIQSYLGAKTKLKADANLSIGKKFMEDNKSKPGVKVLPDGMQYIVMKEGTGAIPTLTDTVVTMYHGTLVDGSVFDSSVERNEPAEFGVTQVIKGWTEALTMMKVGSKWKLFIPAELAWGDRAAGPKIPANSTVIFEVELLSIKGK